MDSSGGGPRDRWLQEQRALLQQAGQLEAPGGRPHPRGQLHARSAAAAWPLVCDNGVYDEDGDQPHAHGVEGRVSLRRPGRYLAAMEARQRAFEARRQEVLRERLRAEVAECTFAPKITPLPRFMQRLRRSAA